MEKETITDEKLFYILLEEIAKLKAKVDLQEKIIEVILSEKYPHSHEKVLKRLKEFDEPFLQEAKRSLLERLLEQSNENEARIQALLRSIGF
jgi:hypothetical protein|nr:MAG TPA: hypothetical protein [Caudoviricetes sp.]